MSAGMNRRGLAGVAGLALLLGELGATAQAADATRPTTADFAAADFAPVPGLEDALGTYGEWRERTADRYAFLRLAAAVLAKTPDEMAAAVAAMPDEHGRFLEGLADLEGLLEAETRVLRAAQFRIAAGGCRAGLA